MARIFTALFAAALCAAVAGCQQDKSSDMNRDGEHMSTSADACTMCPGVQKATADGKCPTCGMKLSSMSTSGDACAMCEGVQTATADGKCPKCGMKLSKM